MIKNGRASVYLFDFGSGFNTGLCDSYISMVRKRKLVGTSLHIGLPKSNSVLCQSIAAELTVCAAMKAIGLAYSPPEYGYDGNGKPYFTGGCMSITHTKGFSACAIASVPIGIDVERMRQMNPLIAKRILCREEQLKLNAAADRGAFLLRTWTAKESCLKLTGQGLSGGMRSLCVEAESSSIIRRLETGENKQYHYRTYEFRARDAGQQGIHVKQGTAILSVCTELPIEIELNVYNDLNQLLGYLES